MELPQSISDQDASRSAIITLSSMGFLGMQQLNEVLRGLNIGTEQYVCCSSGDNIC